MNADEIRARTDAMTSRTLGDGRINAQHVAIEQSLRTEHGLPSFIARLDGPGCFLPVKSAPDRPCGVCGGRGGVHQDYCSVPTEPAWLTAVRQQADAQHQTKAAEATWTLGQLIERLEAFSPNLPVEFRGCGLNGESPCDLDSWRGVYSDLALGHHRTDRPVTVGDLRAHCADADGRTFEGCKGGDYQMDRSTPVWVDNYSEYSPDRGIVDVRPLLRRGQPVKVLIRVRSWAAGE